MGFAARPPCGSAGYVITYRDCPATSAPLKGLPAKETLQSFYKPRSDLLISKEALSGAALFINDEMLISSGQSSGGDTAAGEPPAIHRGWVAWVR